MQVFVWEMKPLWRKGSPQSTHMLNAVSEGVNSSCGPGAWHFHSPRIDFRMCSPNLASVRKQVPQAVHVKGRRGVGSWAGLEGGEGGEGTVGGRGVERACSRMFVGSC